MIISPCKSSMEVAVSLSLRCLLNFKTEAEPGLMSGLVRTDLSPKAIEAGDFSP